MAGNRRCYSRSRIEKTRSCPIPLQDSAHKVLFHRCSHSTESSEPFYDTLNFEGTDAPFRSSDGETIKKKMKFIVRSSFKVYKGITDQIW
jgi:hypothetical protein